jgi:hypothetical protein
MTTTRRRKRSTEDKAPTKFLADHFKARFGYGNTAESRRCLGCLEMLPDSDFEAPFTPADPLINVCRGCKASPQASSLAEAFSFRLEN